MKCPYCAEEIKDQAVVCRYCGHDFSLFKPLLTRLTSLEDEVKASSDRTALGSVEATPIYVFSTVVVAVLCVILTSGYLLVSVNPPPPEHNPHLPKVLAIVLPPCVLGLALGLVWNRRSRSYFPAGVSLGLFNLISTWLIFASFEGQRFRWLLALVVFAAGQPLTFVTAAILGTSLRNRWFSPSGKKPREDGDPDIFEKITKKFSTVLELLTKLVALVVAVVALFATAAKLVGGP